MPAEGKKTLTVFSLLSTPKYDMKVNCEPLLSMQVMCILCCKSPGVLSNPVTV